MQDFKINKLFYLVLFFLPLATNVYGMKEADELCCDDMFYLNIEELADQKIQKLQKQTKIHIDITGLPSFLRKTGKDAKLYLIKSLSNLEELEIRSSIQIPIQLSLDLKRLKKLKKLTAYGFNSGIFSSFLDLKEFALVGLTNASPEIVRFLECPKLEKVDLECCFIDLVELLKLPNLKELSLDSVVFKRIDLEKIGGFRSSKLESVIFVNCYFNKGDYIDETIKKVLPDCCKVKIVDDRPCWRK